MNFFTKYLLPGIALSLVVFETCDRPAGDKESKTGKAGDQFDLFAVLNTFEKSSSPESFEKSLNSKSAGVNNLDLNEDGKTDYVKVTDKKIDDKSHVLILQVDLDKDKTQDIATIEIEKTGEREAHIQIVGDKDLYGSDYIVEPKGSKAAAALVVATTYAVNVWSWPVIGFIYAPAYVVWASPYYFDYYPVWWEPWPVVVYDEYYPVVSVYHVNYIMSDGYRFVNIHEKYRDNYRVTAKFNYHEKSYGSHDKIKTHEDRGHEKGIPGGGNPRGQGDHKQGPVNNKNDRGNYRQQNDHQKDIAPDRNGGSKQNNHNGGGISPAKDRNGQPKSTPRGGTSKPGGKQSAPNQGGAPHQGSGGHGGGSHGGGHHH